MGYIGVLISYGKQQIFGKGRQIVNLDNYEDPGEADGNKESADHGHGSSVKTEAKQCEAFWKTLKGQPEEDLEALGKLIKIECSKVGSSGKGSLGQML